MRWNSAQSEVDNYAFLSKQKKKNENRQGQ